MGYQILDSHTCSKVCSFHSTYNKIHNPIIHMTPQRHNVINGKLICILFQFKTNTVIRAKIRIKPPMNHWSKSKIKVLKRRYPWPLPGLGLGLKSSKALFIANSVYIDQRLQMWRVIMVYIVYLYSTNACQCW